MCLASPSANNHGLCCRLQSYKIPRSLGFAGAGPAPSSLEEALWQLPHHGWEVKLSESRALLCGSCAPCIMIPLETWHPSLAATINTSPLPEGTTPFVDGSDGSVLAPAHPPGQLCLCLQASCLEKPSFWQVREAPLSILGPSRRQTLGDVLSLAPRDLPAWFPH